MQQEMQQKMLMLILLLRIHHLGIATRVLALVLLQMQMLQTLLLANPAQLMEQLSVAAAASSRRRQRCVRSTCASCC
jgi:hypothetical protein